MADQTEASALRVEVRQLRVRLEKLERLLLTASCLLVGAALVLGALLPYGVEADEDETSFSLLSTVGDLLTSVDDPDVTSGPEEVVLAIGFVGLLVVISLLLVLVLPAVARGQLAPRFRGAARLLAVLGAVGAVVVVLLSLAFVADDGRLGAGGPVLLAGCAGVGLLLSSPLADLVGGDPDRGRARTYGVETTGS